MKYFSIILIAYGLFLTGSAFSRDHHSDRGIEQSKTGKSDYYFSATGYVFCSNNNHEESGKCILKFERRIDGKIFDVADSSNNLKLAEIHCNGHKDLVVNIDAKLKSRNFFSDDEIEILNFEIAGKIETPRMVTHRLARIKESRVDRERDHGR